MADETLAHLLDTVMQGELDALLVLCDYLEEQGDPRADQVRQLWPKLYDDWIYAPRAFQHYRTAARHLRPLFPEYPELGTG